MDPITRANRVAWEAASQKHVREYPELLARAAAGTSLIAVERDLLREVLRTAPVVVHPQSGHGLEDVALVQAGAASVLGVDFSAVAAAAAQRQPGTGGCPTPSPCSPAAADALLPDGTEQRSARSFSPACPRRGDAALGGPARGPAPRCPLPRHRAGDADGSRRAGGRRPA